jgi:hypothetical protein
VIDIYLYYNGTKKLIFNEAEGRGQNWFLIRGCRGRDPLVVEFTTTYAISAYHHLLYSIQHYAIKFVSDFPQVGGFL